MRKLIAHFPSADLVSVVAVVSYSPTAPPLNEKTVNIFAQLKTIPYVCEK
jgi:uncharacterized membrane protein YozB (DUF420 family)